MLPTAALILAVVTGRVNWAVLMPRAGSAEYRAVLPPVHKALSNGIKQSAAALSVSLGNLSLGSFPQKHLVWNFSQKVYWC